ncbi:MAG: prolipoprotein diacylglyceryl transferase [Clostridia bacterium]|nr:prolipoprotein diacylglyceryl transferase [Clostridia bacterium]
MIQSFLANIPEPNMISFPGLGIGEFKLDPVAFKIPLPWTEGESHPVMWYGVIITLAMVIGFFIALRKAKFEGISTDTVLDLAIYLIIAAIVGARLYYVVSKIENFDSFYDVIAIWDGGLGIYGGIIAGALTIFIYTKIKKIKTAKVLDIAAPGLIIGQAIGRWGNFCNAEAHGVVTELPWKMGIAYGQWTDDTCTQLTFGATHYYHPTFLYESLWNIIGFALIMYFYKKKKYDGQPTLWYLVWYGFGRFFIEGLRTDSLYFMESLLGQTIRVSQLVAAICFIGGIAALIVFGRRAKERAMEAEEYVSICGGKSDEESDPAYDVKASAEEMTQTDTAEQAEIEDKDSESSVEE